MRARAKKESPIGRAASSLRPTQRSCDARTARGRKGCRLLRRLCARPRNTERGRGRSRQGAAHRPAPFLVRVQRPQGRSRDRAIGPATGPARLVGIPPQRARETATTSSSSSRRCPIIGRKRLGSAMLKFSCCRDSPICGGAAMTWCWNRRAPPHCSKFAIQGLPAPSPTSPPRGKSKSSVARTVSRGSSFSLCCWTAKSCSRSTRPATMAFARQKVTATSFFGTSTIFCSTRAARKAGKPTRWADFMLMRAPRAPLPAVRPSWPGKKIDLRKLSATRAEPSSPVAKLLRERHSTRTFDDERPITLAELSRFLEGTARVLATSSSSIDLGEDAPVVAYAARPYPSAGAAYELELYLDRRQMRRPCPRILPLRCRRSFPGRDRCPRAGVRSAANGRRTCNGGVRSAANPDHDRRALWPGFLEVQLARLCAHSQGRRRVVANFLSDGRQTWGSAGVHSGSPISSCSPR